MPSGLFFSHFSIYFLCLQLRNRMELPYAQIAWVRALGPRPWSEKANSAPWEGSSSPGSGGGKRRAKSSRRPPSVSVFNITFIYKFLIIIIFWFFIDSLALERKISVRANRDELVQKGILLPESPLGNIPEPGKIYFQKRICHCGLNWLAKNRPKQSYFLITPLWPNQCRFLYYFPHVPQKFYFSLPANCCQLATRAPSQA